MMAVETWLAQVPPSLNQVGSRGALLQFHRAKKGWQKDIELLLMTSPLPRGLAAVHVKARLRFPTSRRRDTGNYQSLLEKATGDALVAGGWLGDDTAEKFSFELDFAAENGTAMTVLIFHYEEAPDAVA